MPIVRIHQGNSLKYLNNNRAQIARSKKDSTDKTPKRARNGATLGFEEKLWQAADKLRGYMDASEYKHVVNLTEYFTDVFSSLSDESASQLTPLEWAKARAEAAAQAAAAAVAAAA